MRNSLNVAPAAARVLVLTFVALLPIVDLSTLPVRADDRPDAVASGFDSKVAATVLEGAKRAADEKPFRSPLDFELPKVPDDFVRSMPPRSPESNRILDESQRLSATIPSMLMMAGLTFLPAAILMTTSFVRIQIALGLLRQALGSPSIPGNQVIVALSLLLTVLVMRPVGEQVYDDAVVPYSAGRLSQAEALNVGARPIKRFMLAQIRHTGHEAYLQELSEYAESQDGGDAEPDSPSQTIADADGTEIPLHVVAPAFLLSELTTALSIGFAIYLPFLVVDLVVATLLAAMGIWMMPPTLVSTPTKLILFVLADGWMLTAGALINGFATG